MVDRRTAGAKRLASVSINPMRSEVLTVLVYEAARRAQAVFLARMRRGVWHLRVVAGVAPFVGIFGTLLGIVNSFRGSCGPGEPWCTFGALAEALVYTLLGLGVGISARFGHRYLLSRLDRFAVEMEAESLALLNLLFTPRAR